VPLAKRVIPCLDVTAGRVVKGINFVQLRDAGDPVEIAARYDGEGADELTFLDITASSDERDILLHVIEAVASRVFIPLTVGGGVRKVEDVRRLLNAGADKVSINTSAVQNPELVREASGIVGNQAIVVAIDAKKDGSSWQVFTHGGRKPTGLDAVEWAKRMADAGAGEIRTHYAGFFDPGFGFGDGSVLGTKVVMEVRAREVPFMVYDGQTSFKVWFERLRGRPDRVYGVGLASSYQHQTLSLSKQFRR